MAYDIMMLFIDERMIQTLGNWYPRVMAVMSCVIPFTFVLASLLGLGLILHNVWRALR